MARQDARTGSGAATTGAGATTTNADECSVCFEPHTDAPVCSFVCAHGLCKRCTRELVARGFHACPVCRAPRLGYTQREVDAANARRTERERERETGRWSYYAVGGGAPPTIFFPDESEGEHPAAVLVSAFRSVGAHAGPEAEEADDEEEEALIALALTSAHASAHAALPRTTIHSGVARRTSSRHFGRRRVVHVDGPLGRLLDQLRSPESLESWGRARRLV